MIEFTPVGFVRCAAKDRAGLPMEGVSASLEILPEYRAALHGVSACSHIWVLCYFDRADRSVLRARPRKISSSLRERGVFAIRSPDRPNPIGLSCVRVLSVKGLKIKLAGIDALDGTPVLDIKPYSTGIDSVPCAAKPDFSAKYKLVPDKFLANTFARAVRNQCGRLGSAEIKAAAFAFKYARLTGQAPESGALEIIHSGLSDGGTDALYALFCLKPSSGAVKKGVVPCAELRVKTTRGICKLSLTPKELREFKALIAAPLLTNR